MFKSSGGSKLAQLSKVQSSSVRFAECSRHDILVHAGALCKGDFAKLQHPGFHLKLAPQK